MEELHVIAQMYLSSMFQWRPNCTVVTCWTGSDNIQFLMQCTSIFLPSGSWTYKLCCQLQQFLQLS